MPVKHRQGLVDALEAFTDAGGEPSVALVDGSGTTDWI
jgi:hypothetical protein